MEKKPSPIPGIIALAIALGAVAFLIYYTVGYEIGLRTPKFKPGQCVVEYDEFGDLESVRLITKVSNRRYKYAMITRRYDGVIVRSSTELSSRIWMLDEYDTRVVQCPEFETQ